MRGGKLIRLVYCGTLGYSYDITCIIDAIKKLDKIHQKKIQFIVMGDGPQKQKFQEQSQNLPIVYTGRLPYPAMVWILSRCDIAVNPISKGAAQSIINKHMDYAMAGLPVISTQENLEYRMLLDEYKAGISCKCEDSNEVCNTIKMLIDDAYLRKTLGKNSLNLAIEKFDRKQSYVKLYELF